MSDIQKLLTSLARKSPMILRDTEGDNFGSLTTGSIAADAVTVCGGFPRARVSEVSGMEASGKTTLALSAAVRAVLAGLHVSYLDFEQALDFEFAGKLGLSFDDPEKAVYLKPKSFEEGAEACHQLIMEEHSDLIIFDSVSAMIPQKVFEGDIADDEAVAMRARKMSAYMPRLVQSARESNRHPAVVLINQLRHTIPTSTFAARFGAKTTTSGGVAIRFFSSLRMEMKQVRKGYITRKAEDPFRPGKETEIPVANEHSVDCTKNKVGAAYRDAPLWIRYDDVLNLWGIDNVSTLLDMAVAANLIEKKSSGIYKLDGQTVKGAEDAHARLLGMPELCTQLAKDLGLDWTNYSPIRY
jgi:recombination protein RecA